MICLGPTGPLPERPTDRLHAARVCRCGGQERTAAGRPPALPLRRKLLRKCAAYVSALRQKGPRIDTVHTYARPTDSDMSRPKLQLGPRALSFGLSIRAATRADGATVHPPRCHEP